MSKKNIALCALAALALPLAAQEAAAAADTAYAGESDEDVIIVTAAKIDEDISKTTEHVEVITSEMIEQSGAHTLNEVLNAVPGVSFIGKTVGNSEPLQMNGFTDEYVKILVDGGIRSGVDVFRALALGADAVLIGRPVLTAIYGGGAEGFRVYMDKIVAELKSTMTMCGAANLKEITRDKVWLG